MSTLRRQPVSRGKVLAGALVAVVVFAGLVALSEWLRPSRDLPASPITAELDTDPRVVVDCPAPHAREGSRTRTFGGPRPADASSTELYDCPTTWDGRTVRFTGEVVGAVLRRGAGAWLQLNDDAYAGDEGPLPFHRAYRGGNGGVGVLVPLELAARITDIGGPGMRGDVVQVTGVFHRVDRETREVGVVRANTLRVVSDGGPVSRTVDPARVVVAAVLALLAGVLLALQWRAHRRS